MSYRDRLQQRLEDTGRPLRIGLVGAGQMGRGLAAQLLRMPGISLSAVLDVDRNRAEEALGQAGIVGVVVMRTADVSSDSIGFARYNSVSIDRTSCSPVEPSSSRAAGIRPTSPA